MYLQTSVSQQYERTHRDRNRPLLQTDNPLEVLTKLFEQRHPLYEALADIRILTDKRTLGRWLLIAAQLHGAVAQISPQEES